MCRFTITHSHALCIEVQFVVAFSAQGSCLAETGFFMQLWAFLGLSQPASQPSSQPASQPALCYIRLTCLIRHFDLLLFMCADSQDLWIAFRFHLSFFTTSLYQRSHLLTLSMMTVVLGKAWRTSDLITDVVAFLSLFASISRCHGVWR